MNAQNNFSTLRNFINARVNLNGADYYDAKGYRRDAYTARTQKKHALELLDLAERIGVKFDDTTPRNCMPFLGRVKFVDGVIDYTVGGYAPTEKRAQAARFIAAHVWDHLKAQGRDPRTDAAVRTLSRGAREYITN